MSEPITVEDQELKLSQAEAFVKDTYEDLRDMKRSYFRVAFRLSEARDNGYFRVLGYDTIEDLAEDKFQIERTTTYNLMQVYEFARDWHKPMQIAEEYEGYSQSQLLEMSRRGNWAHDGLVKRIKPSDSVASIKAFLRIWNREYKKTGRAPEGATVAEVLKRYGEAKPKQIAAPAQEAPQPSLINLSEVEENSVEESQVAESVELLECSSEASEDVAEGQEFVQTSGQNDEEAEFEVMTDDELINFCIKFEPCGCTKFQIYEGFCSGDYPERNDFIEFVKEQYGNFGIGANFINNPQIESLGSEKREGLTIKGKSGAELTLNWGTVAGRIVTLILNGDYLSEVEQAEYKKWKDKKDGRGAEEEEEPISDDELRAYCLREGTGFESGKFRIYDKALNGNLSNAEFTEFVKKEYGTGSMTSYKYYACIESSSIGLKIQRRSGGNLILTWSVVAGRIKRQIEAGEYLTANEQARYIQWKAEQDGLTVIEESAAPAEPEQEPETAAQRLNLKNEKARREWLDAFRAWGVWLEVPQVDKAFYRFDFANGCAVIVEVGFEYWDSYSTHKGAHERVSYSIIDEDHPKFNSQGESYTSVIQWLTKHAKEI